MLTGWAKPIRIIGDPGNQLSDKWSSTVLVIINSFSFYEMRYILPLNEVHLEPRTKTQSDNYSSR